MIKCYRLKPDDEVIDFEMDGLPMMGLIVKDKLWFNFDDIVQYLDMDLDLAYMIYNKMTQDKRSIMMVGVDWVDYVFISEDEIYDIFDDEEYELFIANLYVDLKYKHRKCKR